MVGGVAWPYHNEELGRYFALGGFISFPTGLVSAGFASAAVGFATTVLFAGALVLAFALAVLALGNSLALAPLAFSLVLSVGVLLATESMATSTFPRIWAIVCGLFWLACMHQVDERAGVAWLLGAMVLAGGLLDAKTANRPMLLPWLLIWLLLGPLLISFNPALGFKWILPPEFLLGGLGLQSSARSPFQPVNWDAILAVPSAMA